MSVQTSIRWRRGESALEREPTIMVGIKLMWPRGSSWSVGTFVYNGNKLHSLLLGSCFIWKALKFKYLFFFKKL